jgi:hypothetical protein
MIKTGADLEGLSYKRDMLSKKILERDNKNKQKD